MILEQGNSNSLIELMSKYTVEFKSIIYHIAL
jgi:hypothetical protein